MIENVKVYAFVGPSGTGKKLPCSKGKQATIKFHI